MRNLLWISSVFLPATFSAQVSLAQSEVNDPNPISVATTKIGATTIVIKRDTPVELLATKEISTADAVAGTRFRMRVNKAIIVDDKLVVPVGAWAMGEVLTASDSGGLGKSGKMTARLLYIELGDAKIPLEGEISTKGQGAGSAGVAILVTGWAGLFHRGNNAKIKAGELTNAFIAEDVTIDMSVQPIRRVEQ
jgi:hypothetical protein